MTSDQGPAPKNFPEDWLSAYLDGELTEQQLQEVASRLEQDSVHACMLEEIASARKMIRSLPTVVLQRSAKFDLTKLGTERPLSDLEDGLAPLGTTATFNAFDGTSKIKRNRLRSFLAVAASLVGLIAVGVSLWNLDFFSHQPMLSHNSPTVETTDVAATGSTPSQPDPKSLESLEIVLPDRAAKSLDSQETTFAVRQITEESNVVDQQDILANADDVPVENSLDWLINEGVSRALQFDLAVSTHNESPNSTDFAVPSGDSMSFKASSARGASGAIELSDAIQHSLSDSDASKLVPDKVRSFSADSKSLGTEAAGPVSLALEAGNSEGAVSEAQSLNSAQVTWYRSENWSDAEVINQQNAHPMLQTLQEHQAANKNFQRTRNSTQLGQQAARGLDPSGLLPLAILRIPLDQSQQLDQVVKNWQVTPEWTAPDESIRVLFVSADQMKSLLHGLPEMGETWLSWLRPAQQASEPEKITLVVHFYTNDQASRLKNQRRPSSEK